MHAMLLAPVVPIRTKIAKCKFKRGHQIADGWLPQHGVAAYCHRLKCVTNLHVVMTLIARAGHDW